MTADHAQAAPVQDRHLNPRLSVAGERLAGITEPHRRVCGSDHDDPHPYARPGHTYRELVGGPLDGLLLDVTGWDTQELPEGAALLTEIGRSAPEAAPCTGPALPIPGCGTGKATPPDHLV